MVAVTNSPFALHQKQVELLKTLAQVRKHPLAKIIFTLMCEYFLTFAAILKASNHYAAIVFSVHRGEENGHPK